MSFRLVPNSVTLDDLERRYSPNRRVISPNSVAFGADSGYIALARFHDNGHLPLFIRHAHHIKPEINGNVWGDNNVKADCLGQRPLGCVYQWRAKPIDPVTVLSNARTLRVYLCYFRYWFLAQMAELIGKPVKSCLSVSISLSLSVCMCVNQVPAHFHGLRKLSVTVTAISVKTIYRIYIALWEICDKRELLIRRRSAHFSLCCCSSPPL